MKTAAGPARVVAAALPVLAYFKYAPIRFSRRLVLARFHPPVQVTYVTSPKCQTRDLPTSLSEAMDVFGLPLIPQGGAGSQRVSGLRAFRRGPMSVTRQWLRSQCERSCKTMPTPIPSRTRIPRRTSQIGTGIGCEGSFSFELAARGLVPRSPESRRRAPFPGTSRLPFPRHTRATSQLRRNDEGAKVQQDARTLPLSVGKCRSVLDLR